MNIQSAGLIYFSPTGTTRKIVSHIARGMGATAVSDLDLTLDQPLQSPIGTEVAIVGAPVYAGRIPLVVIQRLAKITPEAVPAVVVVLYGNRAYEDALLELIDLSRSCGFHPVAAGAFIGEHSFATETYPIAVGRPDPDDLALAEDFGARVARKLSSKGFSPEKNELSVPGNYPYKKRPPGHDQSPSTQADHCILCGTCGAVCPTQVIEVTDAVTTDQSGCISCCACIKSCPTQARIYTASSINEKAQWLNENFTERKAPEVFV